MNRNLILWAGLCLIGVGCGFVGCLQSGYGTVAGTSVNANTQTTKNTFVEREFAADSTLAAHLEHVVAVHLEAAGTHDGDTGSQDGVDEIPYELARTTTMSLGVPLAEGHGHWIEWCYPDGKPILVARGSQASSSVKLKRGRYLLRIHHSNSNNEPQMMFVRATTNKASLATAQQREIVWDGRRYDDDFNVFCAGSDPGIVNSDFDEDLANLWLTGDLSCANIYEADFSTPELAFGILLINFNKVSNALFTNCKFDRSDMNGAMSDSTFVGCSFVDTHWSNLKITGNSSFQRCDLTNRFDLENLDAGGITFENCNFSGTKIGNAHLSGASIRNCNFSQANFSGAVLDSCPSLFAAASGNNLAEAKFAGISVQNISFVGLPLGVWATDWSGANFTAADLSGQTLAGFNLAGATFTNCNLSSAICTSNTTLANGNFTGANLENGNFSGSSFSHAAMDHVTATAANLANCVFDGISAHGTTFAYANLSNAKFAGAQLGSAADSGQEPAAFTFAYMPNARITDNADCRNVDFSNAHFYGAQASVQNAELTAANFSDAVISGMDFSGATLESASFERAQAIATKFVGARLTDAKFISAYLMGADFTNAFATSAVFADAAVSTAPCTNESGCQSCLTDACSFADLDLSRLCCYSYSEPDGTVYAVTFDETKLPNDPSIVCPNGELGPCTGNKLKPRDRGPYPPVPACIPTPFNFCPQPTAGD